MSLPRYVLCPGYVISRTDGQRHFVGVSQLRQLYGVPRHECVTYPQGDGDQADILRRIWRAPPGSVELRPRYDGDYTLPALR
jgi:hypothetical protein